MRFLQWLSRIGLVLAVACFGLAIYFYWLEMDQNRPEHEIYRIENPTIVLDNVTAGVKIPVTYQVRNLSNRPIQVVGMEFSCGVNWCCLRGKLSEPITIAPGAVGEVPAEVSVNEYAKTFSHEVELFLNDGRWLRQPKVGVKGTTDPATVKPLPPEPAAPTPTPPATKPAATPPAS